MRYVQVGSIDDIADSSQRILQRRKLRELIEKNQMINQEWADEQFEVLRGDEQYRFDDILLINEQGRVARSEFGFHRYSSIRNYLGYPKIPTPPTIDKLIAISQESGSLTLPMTSRRNVILVFDAENLDKVYELTRLDLKAFTYADPRYGIAFTSPDSFHFTDAKNSGFVLGSFGFWPVTQHFVSGRQSDEALIYAPRVYISQHPEIDPLSHIRDNAAYITPYRAPDLIASGHEPMDRRIQSLRIEMAHLESDEFAKIFEGYRSNDLVNGFPLLLRHFPRKTWVDGPYQHPPPRERGKILEFRR